MLRKTLGAITDSFALIGGVALVLMMVHINLDVIGKYVFGIPIQGTIEIVSAYYMVAVVFLPLAMVERADAHITVELVSQHLPERAHEILVALASLAAALYFALFTWQTWLDAVSKFEVGETTVGNVVVVVWPSRFMLPIGLGLITVLLVYKAVRLFRHDSSMLQPADLVPGTE